VSRALRQRLGRVGLVVALLAGVLVVSFGSGYRASQAVLDDGSAHLTKGHVVVRVNGESRQVDAKLTGAVAKGKETLRVVELPDGQLYVENTATGARSKVDTTTMRPQPLPAAGKDPRGSLVGGGSEMYSVDRTSGTVAWIHSRTRAVTPVVKLGVPVQGVEVDSRGTAWVLAGGKLHEISRSEQRPTVDAAAAGEQALLTLVGDRPTVLRPTAGEAVRYGRTPGDAQRARVPDLTGEPADRLSIATPGPGDVLWVAAGESRRLVRVDLPTAQVRSVQLPKAGDEKPRHGRPVLSGNRVLVPDYAARAVHVLDAATGQERRLISRVPGTSREFDVAARGSKVFINDQYASRGLVVDRDGTDRTIDKGTGDGLDGNRRTAPPPTGGPPPTGPSGDDDPAGTDPPGRSPAGRQPAAPPPVPVPDVVGDDRQAACAALRAVRLDCVQVPVGNDGAGRTGEVLRTAPAAGTTVPVGQLVTVSYRGDIQLPDLVGLPSAAACAALEAAGLRCERTELPPVADAAAVDKVSTQDPAPGSPAQTGDRVRISYPSQVLVPDVRTLLAGDACARLAAAGLACTQVDAGTRPAAEPPNVVIDQVPPSGTAATPGTAVSVRFYSSVVVPQVTGLSPADAAAAIAAQGLTPAAVEVPTNQPNVVLAQSPPAGSPAGPGTQVQFQYSDDVPVPLDRYKRSGDFFYSLQPYADYNRVDTMGRVFGTPAPGTAPVYRYVCDTRADCSGPETFYYTMNPNGTSPGWRNIGISFYAYAQQLPGTVPVKALFNGTAWVWAVQGSAVYNDLVSNPARGPFQDRFTLGWVWPP
jgi:beta-lactam-binding protein with PASTA domain